MDYMELWKENGGYGPLTGKACTEKCKMESMIETVGCVAQTISYPEDYLICSDSKFKSRLNSDLDRRSVFLFEQS
ncbi:hypothetical protein AVEN_96579-1 [Araneus ventricosus]|uniref:Uncharacterized protein n=2 Tax=Araneus ventricosus TaxID=182803 RepID=A0A4Y2FZD2_ARAVE|nr:hypothetical protein AVEN_96579-1 [Araneus ventricosus]